MERIVEPELLDSLPPDDPDAVRSRRDLRRINAVMGNEFWIARVLYKAPPTTVVELGAGDGYLCNALHALGHAVIGCDLVDPPKQLPDEISWRSGDIRDTLPRESGDYAVANLFLHHFEDADLAALGRFLRVNFDHLVLCEPLRSKFTLAKSVVLKPFINHVTRNDMAISIRAGFRKGELPALLGIDRKHWRIRERATFYGALRFVAHRKMT